MATMTQDLIPDLVAPADTSTLVRGAHLVGSVNLPTAEDTFRTVAAHAGTHLRRIPDGEVGERFHWILFQGARFEAVPGLARLPIDPVIVAGFDVRPHVLDGSVAPGDLTFGELGYAAAATSSYADFARLRDEGVIPVGTRFQVCLPTPLAPVVAFAVPDARAAVHTAYEAAMLREIEAIVAAVPAEDLAIQLDLASEFALVEGANLGAGPAQAWFAVDSDEVLAGCVARAARVASAVPAGAELGFHLCYGDVAEKHFVEPADARRLVEVANGLATTVTREIDWFHLPVPIERDDVEYVAPLADLAIDPATELYLGVVHHEDGQEGALRRLAAAAQVLGEREIGVGTECGFGRGPSERTAPLLELHAAVARAW
ncbi:hypothetical protein OJAG_11450 [Oerskovia enterophila]|uniref:Methionine synthase n=2 Tax=Oerskovia enterophila TaxID=43678 RepID=A0A163SAN6_9CELL|nr:hypothetical protein OJAG_11450 [Oerskovia enterophila]OCI30479.1 hypothetical protein OERS_28080 [Oerskovia enterophila]